MENQPKLNSSKEVIVFLSERFPLCFTTEGEVRPLKIGIFQDLVERIQGEINLSKTQLRSALRLYTSSWRYLYGVKVGAQRVDLDGNPCGVLDEQHAEYSRKQLAEAKARVQAQRAEQRAKKSEAMTVIAKAKATKPDNSSLVQCVSVPVERRHRQPVQRTKQVVEEKQTHSVSITDISKLQIG